MQQSLAPSGVLAARIRGRAMNWGSHFLSLLSSLSAGPFVKFSVASAARILPGSARERVCVWLLLLPYFLLVYPALYYMYKLQLRVLIAP